MDTELFLHRRITHAWTAIVAIVILGKVVVHCIAVIKSLACHDISLWSHKLTFQMAICSFEMTSCHT